MSVRRIAIALGVAKSSVSVWVRDVDVPRAPVEDPPRSEQNVGAVPSGETRRCSRCRRTLPVEAFNRLGSGRQSYCRDCFRAYFRERGELHRQQVRATAPDRRARSRRVVQELLAEAACTDCGLRDPVVLEFDHVDAKEATVAALVRGAAGRRRLVQEIARCEVVCANCHRRRTATRAGWFRATGRPAPTWSPQQVRNQRHVLHILRRSPCRDCGERDPVVLDFDHRADKRGNVSTMATWASLATLGEEISKCDVRCANCHRRRTLAGLRSYRIAAVKSVSPP
jgi:hypothetical protein